MRQFEHLSVSAVERAVRDTQMVQEQIRQHIDIANTAASMQADVSRMLASSALSPARLEASIQQLFGATDAARHLFDTNVAALAGRRLLATQEIAGLTSGLSTDLFAQTHSQIAKAIADLQIPSELRSELWESLPAAPDTDEPTAVDRWRRGVVQWALNGMRQLAGHPQAFNVLFGILLFVAADYRSGQGTAQIIARQELSEQRILGEVASAEARIEQKLTELSERAAHAIAMTVRSTHVYSAPHTESERLGKLTDATAVIVFACEGQWCRVEYFDALADVHQQGWVYKPRLTFFTAD